MPPARPNTIPFQRPTFGRTERRYVGEALRSGFIGGRGAFTRRCEAAISAACADHPVILTASCGTALEMSALALGIGPGDRVIAPSFTFPITVTPFLLRGAAVDFADILPDSFNLDPDSVARLVGPRTRAIVVVHYAGVAADMARLGQIADQHGLALVEDAAHAYGATLDGRPLGTFGRLGCFSFQNSKNLSAGEGGAIVVNDPALLEPLTEMAWKGTDKARFAAGEVPRYQWTSLASSYAPSDVTAAVLLAQLERAPELTQRRLRLWARYRRRLAPAAASGIALPSPPPSHRHNAHIFALLMRDRAQRDRFLAHAGKNGILCVDHYQPLHTAPYARDRLGCTEHLPVTEDVAARIVRLPLFAHLRAAEVDRVCDMLLGFLEREG
ncbi:dTDP-4-amino-4,6-dideoxygalactose transaminase [Stella sp.]|uniref:dTDP-4-amino-4,6-dideoxygalactose transaminase n=1 Tax=Stella sp. TaxID=2912054 RepID=UPI0035B46F06